LTADEVARELSALAAFYGVEDHFVGALAPWLGSYAELVLAETGFEILTGGKGCAEELARAAAGFEASAVSIDRFRMCDATFPGRMLGLKVDIGAGGGTSVTLYIRLLAELRTALTFLRRIGCAPVGFLECLAPARTVYGLGFFSRGADSGIKTYTVTDLTEAPFRAVLGDLDLSWPRPGFISHRIADSVMLSETKVYLPDVNVDALRATTPRWREILSCMPGLLAANTCTVGISARPSAPPELKLYVDRVGAVPNEFSAR
jgi:hypothetical protein